jgi:hypothetical protein
MRNALKHSTSQCRFNPSHPDHDPDRLLQARQSFSQRHDATGKRLPVAAQSKTKTAEKALAAVAPSVPLTTSDYDTTVTAMQAMVNRHPPGSSFRVNAAADLSAYMASGGKDTGPIN